MPGIAVSVQSDAFPRGAGMVIVAVQLPLLFHAGATRTDESSRSATRGVGASGFHAWVSRIGAFP